MAPDAGGPARASTLMTWKLLAPDAQDAPAAIRAAVADPFATRRQRALAAILIRAPELKGVRDITDHAAGANPYYR